MLRRLTRAALLGAGTAVGSVHSFTCSTVWLPETLRRDRFHKHARNSIESLNAGIKDEGKEHIEGASRRRVRGFAAAQVFVTVLLTNFNLRKIASFLHTRIATDVAAARGKQPAEKTLRRRDRIWYNPYTKTTARESVLELQRLGRLPSPLRT